MLLLSSKRALLAALALASLTGCPKTASNGGDEEPPEVDSVFPANGASGVSVLAVISATFDEAIDPDTVTAASFRLTEEVGGDLVPGTVAAAGTSATFTPTAALDPTAGYIAQLTTDVADTDGNTLESAFSWSFTTTGGEFVLSSPDVAPGGTFPDDHTCAGANLSPELNWTTVPEGTLSWALVFTDLDNGPGGFLHWVIWDIPAGESGLPLAVPNETMPNPPGGGAKQVRSYNGVTYGYLGPCPAGNLHEYQFTVHAIDVATLPNITTSDSLEDAEAEVLAHSIDSASFSAFSSASPQATTVARRRARARSRRPPSRWSTSRRARARSAPSA